MSKILLTGDSFASGEWTRTATTYCATPILSSLLENDGHEVITEAHPGGNDYNSLKSISKHKDDVDVIIFYKTCPSRILEQYDVADAELKAHNYILDETLKHINDSIFYKLENLSNRVFLIGGLNKIDRNVDVEFVLPSVLELLTKEEFPQYELGVRFLELYKKFYNRGLITSTQLEEATIKCEEFLDLINRSSPHFTENDGHPNGNGIKITYNTFKDKI